MSYQPPYQLTNTLLSVVAEIAELIGRWSAKNNDNLIPRLRRENRIRTIQASLAVEQNSLTLEQVTALLNGKTVLGPPKEIQEVHNAFAAYEALPKWQTGNLEHLCKAHQLLMHGLHLESGQFRSGGVGIFRGKELVHMAPPANQVPRLMQQLFNWLKTTNAHPLVASAAFHYELEFIHPFADGNGRIGRLWQTKILSEWQPILAYLPVETVIRSRQTEYYQCLDDADEQADCTGFIEYVLLATKQSLEEGIKQQAGLESGPGSKSFTPEVAPEVMRMLQVLTQELSRTEIMQLLELKDEKHFRQAYQQAGIALGVIEMTIPDKPQSRLQKYRLTQVGKEALKAIKE